MGIHMNMDLITLKSFLFWCTVINIILLLCNIVIFKLANGIICRLYARWYNLAPEEINASYYRLMGVYRILVIVFNIIPWIALAIITR